MLQKLIELDPEIVLADGFDDCLLGVTLRDDQWVALYSATKIINKLDLDWEEAVEYFEFNIAGAYVGPRTPKFVWTEDEL